MTAQEPVIANRKIKLKGSPLPDDGAQEAVLIAAVEWPPVAELVDALQR